MNKIKLSDLFLWILLPVLFLIQGCETSQTGTGAGSGRYKKSSGKMGSSKFPDTYLNDFSQYEIGDDELQGMIVLEGDFTVTADGDNKVVTLPANPLDDFGILFGPRNTGNLGVQARFKSERKGRRYPVFGVAMGGVNGYHLKLNPAHKQLQLTLEGEVMAFTPFQWQNGEWITIRLQREKVKGTENWNILGKGWHGDQEPAEWQINFSSSKEESAGKSSVWAAPYSTQPIHIDDLTVIYREEK